MNTTVTAKAKCNHRLTQMTQIGLIALIVIMVWGYGMQDAGYQIPEEIIIVREPRITQTNPYQEEYEKLLYPTVRISSPSGVGSGVVISSTQIYILTAAHVVGDENIVTIELHDTTVITGTVVITDTVRDLALLRINRDCFADARNDIVLKSAKLAPRDYTPYIFTPVYTVGCSLGLQPRPSQGIISVIGQDNWEVTSPVLPGNSGGPVFDGRTYEVIGIAVWVKVYNGQLVTTMAGIVPINQIYEFLDSATKTQRH